MKKTYFLIIFLVAILFFSIGFFVKHYGNSLFDYRLVTNENININFSDLDINSLIRINNEEDIVNKRNSLIDFIWKEQGFPKNKMPDMIENNILDSRYNDLKNLKQIDKIVISMDYEINSIIYHFIPEQSNNILIIYHQGHSGDFVNGKNTINFFLEKGYSVLAFSMPLTGMNNQPQIDLQNLGTIKFVSHKQLPLLESSNFHPIKLFVEPIVISLNYVNEQFEYDDYRMIGISGGGWTTVLYSAIDERISQSFSIAGSYPLFLRFEQKNISHYEEILPELYDIANYLELYIMAAYGENRDFVQVFNKYDRCCYSGDLYKIYENNLKEKINALQKGNYDVILDDTHKEHKISEHVLLKIDSIMKN